MAKSQSTESILTSGQNEGVERSVLPMPQLASVQNARQRKQGRWGKRYGTNYLPAQDSSGNLLGSGAGFRRNIGPGFCTVDDRCYTYDATGLVWRDPASLVAKNSSGVPYTLNPRIPGAVSGWLPVSSYLPVPDLSLTQQFHSPCAIAYCQGFLFQAIELLGLPIGAAGIRVTAVNPADKTLVFLADVLAPTGTTYTFPKLVTCGSTLCLVYVRDNGAGTVSVNGRSLTTLNGGFGADTVIDAALTTAGSIAGTFDASTFSSTQLLVASATLTANNVVIRLVTATTLATAASIVYSDALPTITNLSVVGAAGQPIYLSVAAFNSTGPVNATRVAVYTTNLSSLVGTATVAASSLPCYSTALPGGRVRCIHAIDFANTLQSFRWVDVSATGAVTTTRTLLQYRYQPMAKPFTVGTQVYMWCTNADVVNGLGYATLLRVPAQSEYPGTGPGVAAASEVCCPVEISAQDFLVTALDGSGSRYGIPAVAQIGTSATWAFFAATFISLPNAQDNTHEFRTIHATHFSDSAANRSTGCVAADGSQFIAGGVLTRVDGRGAVEAGFFQTPVLYNAVASSGGGQTASSTYQYVAIYRIQNSNNRFEVSGVSQPLAVTLAAGQTKVTLNFKCLESSARVGVQLRVYRTLSNGSVFYYVGSKEGSPDPQNTGFGTFVDGAPDSGISADPVLYTQLGQTLPNCCPPPCRFAVSGAQRVWLGGLLRGDIVHASKLILGDQSPSWTDSDAFRVLVPAPVTGLAFMDNLVLFTDEGDGGVYIVTGDGPDDSGDGQFSPPYRLPYAIGCIEPRSVISVDEGTFFQSRRGLYMIPRGFGAPVPAGDTVMDTLASFPIITGVAVVTKPTEQTIRWTCVSDSAATLGRVIVYDLAHKCWSIDRYTDVGGSTEQSYVAAGQWLAGECAMSGPANSSSTQVVSYSGYGDAGQAITMLMQTGDMRPNGTLSEGVISKVCTLAEVRSACTLAITKQTDISVSPLSNRVFALAAGDYQVGQVAYTETELGNTELRDVGSLRVTWSETSALEGVALVALAVEHEQGEGLKRVSPLSRTT